MKPSATLFLLASPLILLFGCSSTHSQQALLDSSLSQFENIYDFGKAEYTDGVVVLESTGNWFFPTKKTYKDFILTAEVLLPDVSEYSNSGIMFRGYMIKVGDSGCILSTILAPSLTKNSSNHISLNGQMNLPMPISTLSGIGTELSAEAAKLKFM